MQYYKRSINIEQTITGMWNKKFAKSDRKKFLHLIDYIIKSIDTGVLKAGDTLPTQRELSKKLNLSIGTITKAFKELEKLGYLSGEIGRGTFVKDIVSEYSDFWYSENKVPYKHNLGHFRTTELINHTIQLNFLSGLKEVANSPELFFKLNDLNNCGTNHQKEVFNEWISQLGFNKLEVADTIILSSEVSTMSIIINALTYPGDKIILEEVGDRIIRDQVSGNQRIPISVKLDGSGIIPEDLEAICKKEKPKLLVTMATLHNPTTITTGAKRKKEILAICEKYNIIIVEDGKVDMFYDNKILPYFTLNPDISIYTTGFYFHLNPTLSTSLVLAGNINLKRIENTYKLTHWASSQMLVEIVTNLIETGRVDKIITERKKILKKRNLIFNQVFNIKRSTHPYDILRWLKLPNHLSSSHLTQVAYENGILVRNSDIFTSEDNSNMPFIRICNGAIHEDKQYELSLNNLKELFSDKHIGM